MNRTIFLFSMVFMTIGTSYLFGIIDGTAGTPLGGLGTGAIKFRAGEGTFTFTDETPTRYRDYQSLPGAQFLLYTKKTNQVITVSKLKAKRENGRIIDDAVFPLHIVHFDTINQFTIELNAFCPFHPFSSDAMATPCALYEFSILNTGLSSGEIAIAFQLTTSNKPQFIPGKGFADIQSDHEKCIFAKTEKDSAVLTAGALGSFLSTGRCENQITGKTNATAMLLHLNPNERATLLFAFAWFNHSNPERYYYTNFFKNAIEVGKTGLALASTYKENAFSFVNRMRASNFPEWLIDHTLASLSNIVNNSIYTKDGRYCHNEGMYFMNGTMDQMWHARQINTQLIPEIAWKELEYWARCQKKSGQIHHDFGSSGDYSISPWDQTEYADYRNIDKWVDLNCGFIISVYEAYIATGDKTKLLFLWPYVTKAGQRILNQVNLYGDPQYPFTFLSSESTYDAGGNSQAYNTGLAIVAYRILQFLARECEEYEILSQYENAFQNAVGGFSKKWLESPISLENYCESMLGGPWIAHFLRLGQFWDSFLLDNLFFTLVNYYNPINSGLGYPGGSYSEWQTYLVSHLGGFALETGKIPIWKALQYDMFERNMLNRNRVYNQPLSIPPKITTPIYEASNSSGSDQYISIPVLWRNYYTVIGFHRNKATGELWLEPIILPEMNHQMKNAFVFCPEGYITINAQEGGSAFQNQHITIASDREFRVDSLYIKDKYGENIYSVRVNGNETHYTRIGTGYQKWLKLYWAGNIGSEAISIDAEGDPVISQVPASPSDFRAYAVSPSQIDLVWKDNASNELGFTIECKMQGEYVQIATVAANETTFSHTGLLKKTEYVYRVSAFNQEGYSSYSQEASTITLDAQKGTVVIAVNAGGPAYQSHEGILYVSDINAAFCHGGHQYQTQMSISDTEEDPLYQSERYGEFSYHFSVSPGDYQLIFKFAEIYFSQPRLRVFNVNVENKRVLQNLDIFLMVGNFSAYDVVVPITVQDSTLDISMVPVIENPKLSALVIQKIEPQEVEEKNFTPVEYCLFQNYPNPFNSTTAISFDLPKSGEISLIVYNIQGKPIEILLKNEFIEMGHYTVEWDARDKPSGIYFYKLETPKFSKIKKMIILK